MQAMRAWQDYLKRNLLIRGPALVDYLRYALHFWLNPILKSLMLGNEFQEPGALHYLPGDVLVTASFLYVNVFTTDITCLCCLIMAFTSNLCLWTDANNQVHKSLVFIHTFNPSWCTGCALYGMKKLRMSPRISNEDALNLYIRHLRDSPRNFSQL